MISHFLVTPPQVLHPTTSLSSLPFASVRMLPHSPTLSCPTAPAYPYARVSNLHRTKGLNSH